MSQGGKNPYSPFEAMSLQRERNNHGCSYEDEEIEEKEKARGMDSCFRRNEGMGGNEGWG